MILVVGGAGYIGSHFVKELIKTKEVVILDNLSTGHRGFIHNRATFFEGDLGNPTLLESIFSKNKIDAVIHFAANSLVGESVTDPYKYYNNNVAGTLMLLNMMIKYDVKKFIFSSTAATYGIPSVEIIDESCMTNPINPYGRSKLIVEQIIEDFSKAYGLNYIVLRYFNAAGAHESSDIGEDHNPETHLIPIVLEHLLGSRDSIQIYGNNYDTPDGTCIRDYIHVTDLARAHMLALDALLNKTKKTATYNLGTGKGYSVKEIIDMCEKVTCKIANRVYSDRRAGDPARLVASYEKIQNELGWEPTYTLEQIIQTAWNWHQKHSDKRLSNEVSLKGEV